MCVRACVHVCVFVHEAFACVEVYIYYVSPLNVMPFHYLANTSPSISSSTTRKMPRISLLVHLRRRRLNVLSGISLVEGMDLQHGRLMASRRSLIMEHMYDVRRNI